MNEASALAYCRDSVFREDYDRYLTALYAPGSVRAALWALYAFNVELTHIRAQVSEPMLGAIRLAWWQEGIIGLYSGSLRAQPVLEALAKYVVPLVPQLLLQEAIEARRLELENEQPESLEEIIASTGDAGSAIAEAALWLCLGGDKKPHQELVMAVRHVGAGAALSGVMRGLIFEAKMRQRDAEFAHAQSMLEKLTTEIEARLDQAQPILRQAPAASRPAWILAACVREQVRRVRKSSLEPAELSLGKGLMSRQVRLFWAAATGRY